MVLHSHYIRIFTTSNNTFLKTSLQTSLQNQAKQEGNEKVTSSRSGVKLKEMIKCIVHRIKNIFSFSEKAGRLDFILTNIGIVVFVTLGDFVNVYALDFLWGGFPSLFQIIFFLGVYLLIPNICRRTNDLKMSRASFLLLFIPIVNILFELYLFFAPGKK